MTTILTRPGTILTATAAFTALATAVWIALRERGINTMAGDQ